MSHTTHFADLQGSASDGEETGNSPLRPRLLVIEDNPMNRLMIGEIMRRLNFDHVAVGCAEEAVLRFAREAFDAVLLDVAMDDMAGLHLARALVGLVGRAGVVPILALGRSGLDDDVLAAAGFSGCVEAPIDASRITAALIAALEDHLPAVATEH